MLGDSGMGGRLLTEQEIREFRRAYPRRERGMTKPPWTKTGDKYVTEASSLGRHEPGFLSPCCDAWIGVGHLVPHYTTGEDRELTEWTATCRCGAALVIFND